MCVGTCEYVVCVVSGWVGGCECVWVSECVCGCGCVRV